MSEEFDLGRYFERIGYGGSAKPDLETLSALHARQVATIAFENLDPLLGRPVRLDAASLQAKLVDSRRGGYCFELNGLFKLALEAIGFRLTGLTARVCWMAPPERPPGPRTHMLMRVDLDAGPFLADVGFGGFLLDAPIRLQPDLEQATPAGLHRITLDGERHTLAARLPDAWSPTYVFTQEPAAQADYEMGSWFTATHPESLFRNGLLAERLTAEARYSLFNTKLTERRRGGDVIERTLESAADLGETLETLFGVDAPDPAEAVWAKLPRD